MGTAAGECSMACLMSFLPPRVPSGALCLRRNFPNGRLLVPPEREKALIRAFDTADGPCLVSMLPRRKNMVGNVS